MTERSLGANFKWFIAKVVNRGDGKEGDKDSTESGRVQIRIYGKHDDVKNVPDKQLPWAVPLLPIGTGASKKGVGASPVGLQKDSTVVGFYADKDETIPILFGVLHKAGTDKGDDGTELEKTNNDVPKGARTSGPEGTGGGDKNDVLDKRITEEVGKEGQHHKDKKTIGDVPFQGEPALDAIKQIDPSNLSGSIPGAINGMKSIVNTLGVAGSLLANFKALTSGKLSITGLLAAATNISGATSQLTGQLSGVGGAVGQIASGVSQISGAVNQIAATTLTQNFGGVPVNMVINGRQGVTAKFGNVLINISHRYDSFGNVISSSGSVINNGVVIGSGNMAQIAIIAGSVSPQASKILAGVQAASIASNLIGNAFGGSNPLQTVINGLGGLSGLQSLAAKASSLLGPLTANFGAAVAIAGSLRSQTQIAFAGIQAAPFRSAKIVEIPKVLQKIGNIAGIINNVAGAGRIVSGNIPIVPAIAGALGNALNIPSSLINSSIQLPLTTLAVINTLNRRNPGVSIGFDNRNTVIPRIIPLSRPFVSPAIINPIRYTNPSFRISSLNNSVINVNIPILNTRVIFNTINSTPGIGFNVAGIGIRF